MAAVEFAANNALSNQLWEQRLNVEVIEATYLNRFVGTSADSMIQEKIQPNKNPGDRVTCGLRGTLSGPGKQGNAVLKGDTEAFTNASDTLFLDLLRHGTAVPAGMTIDAQRVPYELREEGFDSLKQWYADRLDDALFNQLCGFTPQTDTRFTGNQAVIAPSTNNIMRAKGIATDALVAADSTATLTLASLDAMKERAKTMRDQFSQPIIRPCMVMGEPFYVVFIHDFQLTDLRRETGDAGWFGIQRAAMQGGAVSGNPIFTGAAGVYNNMILHVSTRVTNGVTSGASQANTKRAVLCGAQAAWISWGQGYGATSFRWVEELEDFGHQLEIAVGSIWGLKKSVFNSVDFATIVQTTYAAAHTS